MQNNYLVTIQINSFSITILQWIIFYDLLMVVQCQLINFIIILHLLFYWLVYILIFIFKDETLWMIASLSLCSHNL
jgi:hypothetical protein